MIRNYILVALRNITRNKFFSAINIIGLAVSMTICMAIIMLVADQMLYDRYNTKRDRIYRINSYSVDHKGVDRGNVDNSTSPMPLGAELLGNYTGVEKVVRFRRGFGNGWLEFENQNVNIPLSGFFADAGALDLFEYELQYGDAEKALVEPYSVVLTRKAARKLFKEENPIGQTIKVGENGTYTVTGVLKETEKKSHIVFEALASMSTLKSLQAQGKFKDAQDNWTNFWDGWTYILLEPGKKPGDIQPHLEKIYQQHIASIPNPEIYRARFRFHSLKEITPGPLINNPIGPSLPWVFVYFLGGLAGVIMLTSCFNFTNLSVARSLKRAKEIGVRKVTGAARWQIFTQFLSESVVISLCSLVLAFFLLIVVKPLMLQLTFARIFKWDLEANYVVFGLFILFAIFVGILAGFFPAVILSGFQPVKVLKKASGIKLFSRMGLRKTLLVTQFTLSLFFILTVIVMYNQLALFTHKDYGFSMKNNIMLRLNNTDLQPLKTELLKYSNIQSVAGVSHIPAAGTTYGEDFKKSLDDKAWTGLNYFMIDEDYLRNLEITLVAGEFFSSTRGGANKDAVVVNRRALQAFHYKTPTEALGEEVIFKRDSSRKVIIGVVEDYNHEALMSEIQPLALLYDPSQINLAQVKYSGTFEEASRTLDKAWSAVNPGLKVDYKDLESEIKQFYHTIFGDIVNVLSVIASLAILISCLGLLGMATYTIESRMKEISVRKVLGSSDGALVFLLSRGFLQLLLIAILIGAPMAGFINNVWLQLIAYHTELGVGSVAIGVVILLTLAGITIGSQTLRAAFTNPVENLKNE